MLFLFDSSPKPAPVINNPASGILNGTRFASERTTVDDRLDRICRDYYGTAHGTVEAVLAFNPGLADRGIIIKAGTLIRFPEAAATTANTVVRLWT